MKNTNDYQRIEQAIQFIVDHYQEQPELSEVAQHVHLSKYHFQRMFHQWAGVSPKSFLQYITLEHAKELLAKGHSTFNTSLEVGLSGTSRLHDLFVKIESVSPGEYKSKGAGMQIHYQIIPSIFGEVLVAETPKGICQVSFIDDDKGAAWRRLRNEFEQADFVENPGPQSALLEQFFKTWEPASRKLILDIRGTPFQIKVWNALLNIPKGELVSYGDIARKIGQPKSSRAVGTAIARNPVAYLIPCHRVIRQSGETGQYRWGSTRKRALIGWESLK